MTEQLREIGSRLSALRSIAELTPEAFCEKTGVSVADLALYEKGELDFSFSFLYNAARVLGVDVVDLMSGDSPRLSDWCIVRNGGGYAIDRRAAYAYRHLAFTFRDKKAEPFMVTVEPKGGAQGQGLEQGQPQTQELIQAQPPTQHAHDGQEFNWMVAGRMKFYISNMEYILEPGDSVYFNASIPHAMQALDNAPARFLAVVMG